MIKYTLYYLRAVVFGWLMLISGVTYAQLQALDDDGLSKQYGQAIFELKKIDQVRQPQGSRSQTLDMLRLTMGAHIEINANVAELSLGRYWRPEGNNCTGGNGGNKICYNQDRYGNPTASPWACTAKPCGSVGLGNKAYEASKITHGGQALDEHGHPRHFYEFAAGFEADNGIDIKLRDVTMGQIRDRGDGVYEMTPFVMENPYFELAFEKQDLGGGQFTKKLVGIRMGSEDSFGYQGNIIDVISGFILPSITADAGGLGSLSLEASLGGVRTIGWIDKSKTDVLSATGFAALLGSPGGVEFISAAGQLYPVQSNYIKHSKNFFLSLGTRAIQWSDIDGARSAVTAPGFWINMGGDGRLISYTKQGDHPNNYFPGHPNFDKYLKSENYNNPQASWSSTYAN